MAGKSFEKGADAPFSLPYLKSLLDYNPVTGIFTWKVDRKRGQVRAGSVAGAVNKMGYVEIGIDCCRVYAHRLAWFFQTSVWPENEIDHKDRIKTNNAFDNLREADGSQNVANVARRCDNSSGYKGVSRQTGRDTWVAEVSFRGIRKRRSGFLTAEEAHKWAVKMREHLHGEFSSDKH